ncbi:hypothetical protein BDK51DRAFT_39642 [Blyttiomyces helicus]|uniref:Uncharacterized protein n=1 Tax=Blyttiomyces helicus TaxID=388810 RepID=A0A4P9W8E5_9FUNG|nr:hypothetical protein BDK51DRAFT_39642 [Blyttiomyces helicus]|eukprot:RKO87070.1 hypothetical protein BDK51DRAFT_39642 [Blyttiomyces helicus]
MCSALADLFTRVRFTKRGSDRARRREPLLRPRCGLRALVAGCSMTPKCSHSILQNPSSASVFVIAGGVRCTWRRSSDWNVRVTVAEVVPKEAMRNCRLWYKEYEAYNHRLWRLRQRSMHIPHCRHLQLLQRPPFRFDQHRAAYLEQIRANVSIVYCETGMEKLSRSPIWGRGENRNVSVSPDAVNTAELPLATVPESAPYLDMMHYYGTAFQPLDQIRRGARDSPLNAGNDAQALLTLPRRTYLCKQRRPDRLHNVPRNNSSQSAPKPTYPTSLPCVLTTLLLPALSPFPPCRRRRNRLLPRKFDVIESANLVDTIGLLNVLSATAPLLKPAPRSVINTASRDLLKRGVTPPRISPLCDIVPWSPRSLLTDARAICYNKKMEEFDAPGVVTSWFTTAIHHGRSPGAWPVAETGDLPGIRVVTACRLAISLAASFRRFRNSKGCRVPRNVGGTPARLVLIRQAVSLVVAAMGGGLGGTTYIQSYLLAFILGNLAVWSAAFAPDYDCDFD